MRAFQVRLGPPSQQPEAGRDLPEGGEEGARKWPMEDGGHRRGLGDKVLLEIKIVRKYEFPLIKNLFFERFLWRRTLLMEGEATVLWEVPEEQEEGECNKKGFFAKKKMDEAFFGLANE